MQYDVFVTETTLKTGVYIIGYDRSFLYDRWLSREELRAKLEAIPGWRQGITHLKVGKSKIQIPNWTPCSVGERQIQVADLFKSRLSGLQVGTPHKLELCHAYTTYRDNDKGINLETGLHDLLSEFHTRGEWFSFPREVKWYEKVAAAIDQFQVQTHAPVTHVGDYNREFDFKCHTVPNGFCGGWIKCNHRPWVTNRT
jgi:hypothetical protein